jgi:hypothetical protein
MQRLSCTYRLSIPRSETPDSRYPKARQVNMQAQTIAKVSCRVVIGTPISQTTRLNQASIAEGFSKFVNFQ